MAFVNVVGAHALRSWDVRVAQDALRTFQAEAMEGVKKFAGYLVSGARTEGVWCCGTPLKWPSSGRACCVSQCILSFLTFRLEGLAVHLCGRDGPSDRGVATLDVQRGLPVG